MRITAPHRVPILAASVYLTACSVLGISLAISTSIHASSDDFYPDNSNSSIYYYHISDGEENAISNSSDWFFGGFTDSPQETDLTYITEGDDEQVAFVPIGDVDSEDYDKRKPLKPEPDSESNVVEKFLQHVEEYNKNKADCKPGTEYNLGSGVIKQYGLNRFQAQAMVAVNRANFLTRIWRYADSEFLQSEYLFYTQVRNIVEGDPDIFAAGNCYDKDEFKDYHLFCPFSHRTEDGRITVKDLSLEYPYLGNTSDWFFSARMRSAKLENFNITKACPQQRNLRLSGPPSGKGAGGSTRILDKRVTADLAILYTTGAPFV
ncbi:G-protein coupled receptor [Plakobranchus ocellatus]|uniref:G-protein coupled receptor n=1 Tax=Plakobranchus ocellatus TaxID=259542 RepID=A0AAV4BEC3_9GAST|nr:G-protein coupled receptor [Plakobranchus ocellatus]